ncbi:hypothetical protein CPB83DRAFT_910653 [Crepidotus variabilis]|uniref:DUF6699 domain-containing protein n=1 Tax=Crepidotus variabilis TaxID=179855 RepID=A0A9P6E698_9AGAR|nr:hypothetical protein CPB83DRAFT_910653 [Crepidotus variabilis]
MNAEWYSSSAKGHYPETPRRTQRSILKHIDQPSSSRYVRKTKNVRFQPATWVLPPGNDMNSLSNLMQEGYGSWHQAPTSSRSSSLRRRRPTPWLAPSALPTDDFYPPQSPIMSVHRKHHAWNSPNPKSPLLLAPLSDQWNNADFGHSFSPNPPPQYNLPPATPRSSSVSVHSKAVTDFAPCIPQDNFYNPNVFTHAGPNEKPYTAPSVSTSYLPVHHTIQGRDNHAIDHTYGIPKQKGTLYTTPVMPLSPLPGFSASSYGSLPHPSLTILPGTPIIPCLLVPSAVYSNPGVSYDRYIIPRRPDEEDDSSLDDPESHILREEMLFNAQMSWDVRLPPSSAITHTTDPRDWSRTLPVNLGTTALKGGVKTACIGFYDIKHWQISDTWGDIKIQQYSDSPISTGQVLEAIFKYFFEPLTTVDLTNLSMSRTERSSLERARLDRESLWGSTSNIYRRSDLLHNTQLFSKLYLKHSTPRTCHFSLSIR